MPGSDSFIGATPLTVGVSDATPIAGLTTEAGEPLIAAPDVAPTQGTNSAWWKFTATSTGLLTVDSLQSVGVVNSWDVNVSVFIGSTLADLVSIGTDDYRSRSTTVPVVVKAGQTVYVQAMVWPGTTGVSYVINTQFQAFGAPITLTQGAVIPETPTGLSDGYVWPQVVFGSAPQWADGSDSSYARVHARDIQATYGASGDAYTSVAQLTALPDGVQILAIGWTARIMVPSSSFYGGSDRPFYPYIYIRDSTKNRIMHMGAQESEPWTVVGKDDTIHDYASYIPSWLYPQWGAGTTPQSIYDKLTAAPGQIEVYPGRNSSPLSGTQEGDLFVYEVSISFYPNMIAAAVLAGGPLGTRNAFRPFG